MNETKKIVIDIDTRDVRELRDILSDLDSTISELSDSISGFETSFESMAREIGSSSSALEILDGAANTTMAALALLALSSKELGRIPTNIGLAIGALKTFGTGLTVKTGLVGVLGGALKLLPFGLAIGGFTLLVDALSGFNTTSRESRDRIRRLNEILEENRDAHREAIDEINENERRSGILVNTLLRLNGRTENLNDERDEAIRIARILNGAENDLNLAYDEQTGILDDNSTASLEQERSRIAMDASLERSAQHFESLEAAIIAEYEANYENGERLEWLTQQRAELNEKLEEGNIQGANAAQIANGYRDALAVLDAEYYELRDTLAEFNDDVEYHFYHWTAEQRAFEAERDAFIAEHGLSYEILSDQQRDVVHRMLGYWETYVDMGSEMFRKLAYENEVSLEDIIEKQEHNLQATADWQDNLALLYERYGAEVAEHFREMGESGMTLVAEMADDILENYGDMETRTLGCLDNMAEGTESYATQIVDNLELAGELGTRGLALRMEHGAEDVIQIVDDLARQAPETLQEGFDTADFPGLGASTMEALAYGLLNEGPTTERAFVKSGGSAIEALAREIESGQSQLDAEGMELAQTLINSVDRGLVGFDQVGRNMILGVLGGIESLLPMAEGASNSAAAALYRMWKTHNEESSPSRLYMRSGQNMILGLIKGIENFQERPVARAQAVARHMQRVYNNSQREYREIGRNVMEGLRDGLLSREDHLMSAARRIAENMQATMQHALDINSPSRVMREQVGRFIPEGVAVGIDKYAGVAIDSVDKLANDMIKLNIPSIESIIGMGPSLNLSAVTGSGSSTYNNSTTNNYDRMFEGATIQWSGEQDIRQTMKEIAWTIYKEEAVL